MHWEVISMDKVYQGCMLVDERELTLLINAIGEDIRSYEFQTDLFDELVKLYVKLVKEKESISRERAKHEPKTESI
jgi:hypothetical protein